jgi:cell division protein FtsA
VSLIDHGLTPRLKPLSARKSTTLSVLDIGTSKIVCLVAQLKPVRGGEAQRGRTHLARVIGIGHQRSLGLKGGAVVDLEAAETSIRQAIHAAERMAKAEIKSVIVNPDRRPARLKSFPGQRLVRGGLVSSSDIGRVLEAASANDLKSGRAVLHALPTGFSLDEQKNIVEPSGMVGETLGVDLHVLVRRRGRLAQPDARGRALPSRHRGGDRDALRIRPVRARRR